MDDRPDTSLVIVANRLPVRRTEEADGTTGWVTSPGGLVSAVAPTMQQKPGSAWIGWAGDTEDSTTAPFELDGLRLVPVPLTDDEKAQHYDGMSNGSLWPLYHDKIAPSEFHRSWWDGYKLVNQRFADATAATAEQGAAVWIHDYQLQLVPGMLRELRPDLRIGFFLHIPFPPPELFYQLPWREELTKGILGADLIGFQTPDGAGNFHRLAVSLGLASRDGRSMLDVDDRKIRVRTYPIGIDADRYDEGSRRPEITEAARDLRARLGHPHRVILGVDRLDYTKGIDVRLRAFGELLADGEILPSQVTYVQVAEPSRDQVGAYQDLRNRVERLVGEINGDFGRVGFPVVHYLHQTRSFEELLALYRVADMMLVTPFRDGMNLVAKEYVASRYDNTGVLVLSEFAGAAHQLREAIRVNPYDIAGLKASIRHGLDIDPEEARVRMKAMRRVVKRSNAGAWAAGFLDDLDV